MHEWPCILFVYNLRAFKKLYIPYTSNFSNQSFNLIIYIRHFINERYTGVD